MTIRANDLATIGGAVDPQSANGSTLSSDWLDISRFRSALFVLMTGAIDTTIDFKLVEAKDTIGTGSQDIVGRSITALAATDDNRQVVIGVSEDQLTRNSGYRYVRGVVTLGTGATASILAMVAIGLAPRFGPASDLRHADCVQVIG